MAKIGYFAAQKWLVAALLVATVCACGNKGELYRPESEVAAGRETSQDSARSDSRNAIRESRPAYLNAASRFGPITQR